MLHRLRFLLSLLLLPLIAACSTAAPPGPEPVPAAETPAADPVETEAAPSPDALPLDPAVRMGRLDNGLTYYLRHNQEPENRAELRLAVDAGSILEEEDQRGLAHFLEHMLFNGTARFPETELVSFLESTGMRFGPDVNAYTSFDETVYMLTIPTDSAEIIQKAFDVLEDWASAATLSPEEIEKERGVVVEEWRARQQTAGGRISEQTLPAMLYQSRYAERLPIGDPELIRTAPPETIRRFYRNWYRPSLMSVVAVGDFDVDRFESLVREHFADLENPEQAPTRQEYVVPEHAENLYVVATDPELTGTQLQVMYKRPAESLTSVDAYREMLVGRLFNSMLNDRFGEIAREPNAPFMGAGASDGGLVRPMAAATLGAAVQDDSVLTGLAAILTEAERVRQHGFTPTELERQKRELLRGYERAYNERENTQSAGLAGEYVAHFLEDEAAPGIEYEYELVQRLLPRIGLEEVNRRAERLLDDEGRVVVVTMPEKEGLTPPTEAQLAAVFERVEGQAVAAYEEDVSDAPLVGALPAPAEVTDRREIEAVGVTEITLDNGVRVVMKPTEFKDDEVRFTAFSPGGLSLVEVEDLFEAQLASQIAQMSGVGAFDRTELQKRLAGQVVSVSPYLGGLEEGLRGQAAPDDLETMFQLIHLYFTAPRVDSSALAVFQTQLRTVLANRSANPNIVFSDSLQKTMYGDHPRLMIPTVEMVDELDLATIREIYRDRFADAGDFTFVFVGNFDVPRLTELAQTYLGTLPATDRQETWRDVDPDPRPGQKETVVRKGLGDRSTVLLLHHGPFQYTRENRHLLSSMADVLNIMLREELREDRGGVYGVGVNASYSDDPQDEYTLSINFTTDPQRVDELLSAVQTEIERLQQEGPDPEHVATVQEQQRRARETALETNAFWLSTLGFHYEQEDEPLLDVLEYEQLVESLTPAAIQQAAREYLEGDDVLRAILYPERQEAGDPPAES